jgi:hypothetical protein
MLVKSLVFCRDYPGNDSTQAPIFFVFRPEGAAII